MNVWNIRYWLDFELPKRMNNDHQIITPLDMYAILESVQNSINFAKQEVMTASKTSPSKESEKD